MGTKEVDSWSTPSTRLAKLTTEGEDIAESGREGWLGASAARAVELRFGRHTAIEGEGEGGEGDDEYHTTVRISRREQGRRRRQRAEMPVEEEERWWR